MERINFEQFARSVRELWYIFNFLSFGIFKSVVFFLLLLLLAFSMSFHYFDGCQPTGEIDCCHFYVSCHKTKNSSHCLEGKKRMTAWKREGDPSDESLAVVAEGTYDLSSAPDSPDTRCVFKNLASSLNWGKPFNIERCVPHIRLLCSILIPVCLFN